jgi:hypothetical protein
MVAQDEFLQRNSIISHQASEFYIIGTVATRTPVAQRVNAYAQPSRYLLLVQKLNVCHWPLHDADQKLAIAPVLRAKSSPKRKCKAGTVFKPFLEFGQTKATLILVRVSCVFVLTALMNSRQPGCNLTEISFGIKFLTPARENPALRS